MTEVFVGRQPIFDSGLEVVGYELLFRGGNVDEALIASENGATATVVMNAFTEIGLDRIVSGKRAWINVNHNFVVNRLALTLPPALVGLEILEDQVIDQALLNSIRDLKRRGYKIALDDFRYSPQADPLLQLADIVKLDVRALGREGMVRETSLVRLYDIELVAEKVETREEQAFCHEIGCTYFQGYFFCKPEVIAHRRVAPNRLALIQLLAALQDPKIELHDVERLIARDLALSYRLLRYINSAFFGLRREVTSIGHALALLGVENVRRWTTLSIFAGIDEKPPELTVTALVRARFCERAGSKLGMADAPQLFTLGLFSVIDALMDQPIDEVLSSIPFPSDMTEALVSRAGDKGRLLDSVLSLESGVDDGFVAGANELYVEALAWASEAAEGLFNEAAVAA